MDLNKFKLNKERHLKEIFKKLASLTHEPEMYGKVNGELIFGSIASYVFSTEAKDYWNSFLLQILKIKQLENYVSIKTTDDLLKPYLENYLIENIINCQDFLIKLGELEKYRTNKNFHYFIVSRLVSNKIYKFSNIKIGLFEQICDQTGFSFSEKIHLNNQEIISIKKANGTYIENDIFYEEILKEIDKFRGQTVLEIENFGDKYISEHKSMKDAEHFINELIFLRSLCSNLKFKIELNIDTADHNPKPLLLNYEDKRLSSPSKDLIYKSHLDFNNEVNAVTNIAIPFKDLTFPLFDQDYSNDILEKLHTAIDWYASSFKTTSNRESFLFCAIGMEALLSNSKDSITKTLAENTAFLIAKKDIESRKTIYKKMAYLYKHRSGIAHGGNSNIEIKDLQQIRHYLAYSIITIVRKIQKDEIYSVQDLMNYLETQKFG
jgi:hypothetical protein